MFFICRWIQKGNAQKFLDIVKPSLVIFIKYDYWYYYLNEIKKRKIIVAGFCCIQARPVFF